MTCGPNEGEQCSDCVYITGPRNITDIVKTSLATTVEGSTKKVTFALDEKARRQILNLNEDAKMRLLEHVKQGKSENDYWAQFCLAWWEINDPDRVLNGPHSKDDWNKILYYTFGGFSCTSPHCQKPTIDDQGFLKRLSFSHMYGYPVLPQSFTYSIGKFIFLEELDLSITPLETLPESLTCLTSLKKLELGLNKIQVIPEFIGQLTSLTELSIFGHAPRTDSSFRLQLPSSISKLRNLTDLDLRDNALGVIPDFIKHLISLEKLNLSTNCLKGEVPVWFILLTNLNVLDLSINPDLSGCLPSIDGCKIDYAKTKISSMKIKAKPISTSLDKFLVIWHTFIGYADLISDVLSIYQFFRQGEITLMLLNCAFIAVNTLIDVTLTSDIWGKIFTVFQVQPLIQAIVMLQNKFQTSAFVRSKKLDAICRSLPSVVLQLYGLLIGLQTLEFSGILTISLSIVLSVTSASMTLSSLAAKSGKTIFSSAYLVHFFYYFAELEMRLLSISLLFVCIGPITCSIVVLDFICRLFVIAYFDPRKVAVVEETRRMSSAGNFERISEKDRKAEANKNKIDILIRAILVMGSDNVDGPGQFQGSYIFQGLSFITLAISLCLFNVLNTFWVTLFHAKSAKVVIYLNALAVQALISKHGVGKYIERATFGLSRETAVDLIPDSNRRFISQKVSFVQVYKSKSTTEAEKAEAATWNPICNPPPRRDTPSDLSPPKPQPPYGSPMSSSAPDRRL